MFVRDEDRMNNPNIIYNNGDVESVNMLRMKKVAFNQLVNTLRGRQLLRDIIHTCIEEQVVMFLHVIRHNQRFRVIHSTWRILTEIASRYFKAVLYAIGELRGEMIKPASSSTPTKIAESHRWYPYFKGEPCSLDGQYNTNALTFVHIHVRIVLGPLMGLISQRKCQEAIILLTGRKHYTSQNVFADVDFDMKFTYVLAGWEGSTHDATILVDSLERADGLKVPKGWGVDSFFPGEDEVQPDEVDVGHGVVATDNAT
ncbi:uncharacterized protein [Lolium perenne]|uniref:uncharacterized protein n=1 Tax=Lolium perenne TaxID=4522 RepID=UPI003A9A2FB4